MYVFLQEKLNKLKENSNIVELNDYTPDTLKPYVKNGRFTVKFPRILENKKFDCSGLGLKYLDGCPDIVNSFDCSYNNLTSLKYGPKSVYLNYDCSYNNLIELTGSPSYVTGDFCCQNNNIKTLKGSPNDVCGNFDCSSNDLSTLDGSPEHIGGDFNCSKNNIIILKGAPLNISGDFICANNKIQFEKNDLPKNARLRGSFISDGLFNENKKVNLQYYGWEQLQHCIDNNGKFNVKFPDIINGDFDCSGLALTSLEGCPQVIKGDFKCNDNDLTSLKGCPKKIYGDFYCFDNPIKFNINDLPKNTVIKGDMLSENKKINENLLNDKKGFELKTSSLSNNKTLFEIEVFYNSKCWLDKEGNAREKYIENDTFRTVLRLSNNDFWYFKTEHPEQLINVLKNNFNCLTIEESFKDDYSVVLVVYTDSLEDIAKFVDNHYKLSKEIVKNIK